MPSTLSQCQRVGLCVEFVLGLSDVTRAPWFVISGRARELSRHLLASGACAWRHGGCYPYTGRFTTQEVDEWQEMLENAGVVMEASGTWNFRWEDDLKHLWWPWLCCVQRVRPPLPFLI